MSLGALTTTFVPVPSCLSSLDNLYGGVNSPIVKGPVSVDDCFPASYAPGQTNFYSPGFCPYAYTTACSSISTLGDVTETIVTCCPTLVLPRLALRQVHKPPS